MSVEKRLRSLRDADPRWYQIAALSGLLLYGVTILDFGIRPAAALGIVVTALATQLLGTLLFRLPRFDPKSALISSLSLCILLRSGVSWIGPFASIVAIGSKFLCRVRGKHLFNPTNLALVAALLVTARAWVSPAQWGSGVTFALAIACAGGLVVGRARRWDVTAAFLASHAAFLFGRSLWLGEPLAIPLHRMEGGALLLFAFFMISDPKTTPDSRAGRVLFAVLVAAGAYAVQFRYFRTNGLLWSLAACSLLVPLIDLVLPGARYQWKSSLRKENPHASHAPLLGRAPLPPALG